MPKVDEELLLDGLKQLVDIERDWVPEGEGQSYISSIRIRYRRYFRCSCF